MTKPSEREATLQVRRWCPLEGTHQNAEYRQCGWQDHAHRLRLRRMFVCSDCGQGYFKREEFQRHQCGDCE